MPREPGTTVAFVCLHGAAKSVIGAAHLQRLADQRGLPIRATAAGLEPDREIPAAVVQGLLEDGIDVRGRTPCAVDRAQLAAAARVISFGCDLSALVAADCVVNRWDDVPAVSEDFARARAVILARLPALLEAVESSLSE